MRRNCLRNFRNWKPQLFEISVRPSKDAFGENTAKVQLVPRLHPDRLKFIKCSGKIRTESDLTLDHRSTSTSKKPFRALFHEPTNHPMVNSCKALQNNEKNQTFQEDEYT